MSLRAYNLVEDDNRPGWWLATWDEDEMKGGKSQVLPIPDRAVRHLQRLRAMNRHKGSDEWAFPSERDPRVHASVSGVYRILYRLAGRDALIQPKPEEWEPKRERRKVRTERRDLLAEAGLVWWSMHDVRRTLTKFLSDHEMPAAASVILAHELDTDKAPKITASERERANFLKLHTARITRMAYGSRAQFIGMKSEALQLWTDELLDEYERQKALLSDPGDADAA